MKAFSALREALKQKMPPGENVLNTKIKGITVMIHKHKGKFDLFIDGDKLDSFINLNSAKKAGTEFVKQYKG